MKKFTEYLKHPGSLVTLILILLSAAVTIGAVLFIIAYILINGIPNLKWEMFSPEYNTDNLSMLPSIINTLYLTFLTLLIAVPVGVFPPCFWWSTQKAAACL